MVVGIPIVSYTFGNFVKPLNEAFQWSRGQVSLGPSLALLGVTFGQPLLGRLIDRFGARVVILPCAVGFGASWMALYFLSSSLWHFYLLYFFLGLFGGGVGPVPFAAVLSHWFEKKRGLALGLAMVGLGLGGFIMAPLAQHLIATWGWREAYALIGVLVWVIVLPLAGLMLRERPEIYGLLPDGEQPGKGPAEPGVLPSQPSLVLAEAWRTQNFWCLCVAFFLLSIAAHGFLIHLIPLLTDQGFSGQRAAFYVALLAVSSVVGRGVAGFLADKAQAIWAMGSKYVALAYFVGSAVGIVFLWGDKSEVGVLLFAVLFGLSLGAEVDLFPYMVSRCFGLQAFAEIYGYTLAAFGLGGVLGPLLTGIIFDAMGSYTLAFGSFCLLVLAAAGLMLPLQALAEGREELATLAVRA
jgi:MFS family permease